jgi:uroporphyrinogen-III synthase
MNSLSGKSILVTRAAHQADDLAALIQQHGGTPVIAPTIDILPHASWEACDKAIDALYMYDGLVFTSTNGVHFFFQRLDDLGTAQDSFSKKRICSVGEKTRQAVEERGLSVTTMPEKFTAADLANALSREDLHGISFLYPRGSLGNNSLPDALKLLGASVDAVTVYQTAKPPAGRLEACRRDLLAGKIDVVTFTSPSTFENFISFFSAEERRQLFEETRIASIGPVTSRAIEAAGFAIDIQSPQSTVASLVEALINYFTSNNR